MHVETTGSYGGKERRLFCNLLFVQIQYISLYSKNKHTCTVHKQIYTADSFVLKLLQVLHVFKPLMCDSVSCPQNCDTDCDLMRIAAV